MDVEIRLFTSLRKGRDKSVHIKVESGSTPRVIAQILNIPPDQVSMVLINGRNADLESQLQSGDVVSFFPAIGGG